MADKTSELLNQIKGQELTPIAGRGKSAFILPNHSGDLQAGRMLRTPSNDYDIVNKVYCDANTPTAYNVTAGSTKISLGGTPTSSVLSAFSIDVDETKLDHNNLINTHNLTTDINHDNLTGFVANEHIDWTNASSNFKTSGKVDCDGATGTQASPPANPLYLGGVELWERTEAGAPGLVIEKNGGCFITMQNDTTMATAFGISAGATNTHFEYIPGANWDAYFFENAGSGEKKRIYVWGENGDTSGKCWALAGDTGLGYKENGSTTIRNALKIGTAGNLYDSDVVQLTNRTASGQVSIAANTSTAGAAGETEVARFKIVSSAPRVGIGTSSPNETLEVAGKIRANTAFNINGTDGASGNFTTVDGKTVTVTNGIITAIV